MYTLIALLAAALLSAAPLAPTAAEQPANWVKPEERNAALRYWQAFSNITPEMATTIGEIKWEEVGSNFNADLMPPSYKKAAELKIDGAVAAITEAAALRKCNWEVNYEEGFGALLPHLGKLRQSARLMRFAAHQELVKGHPEDAADRIASMYWIADHAASDPILISSLVGIAIANLATTEAVTIAESGKLTPEAKEKILAAMKSVSKEDLMGTRASIIGERDIFLGWVDKTFTSSEPGKQLLKAMGEVSAEQRADIAGLTQEQFRGEIARTRTAYDQFIKDWDSEDPRAAFSKTQARVEAGEYGVLTKLLIPALGKAYISQLRFREDLNAGILKVNNAKAVAPIRGDR